MDEFVELVRKTVDQLRESGESMDSIAARAQITRVYLYNVLSKKNAPSFEVAERMAAAYGIDISVKPSRKRPVKAS